jgi:hypothetical protein
MSLTTQVATRKQTEKTAPVRSRGTTKNRRTKTRVVKTRRDKPLIVADKKKKKNRPEELQ